MGSVEPIYYWKYTLRSRGTLNAVSGRTEHHGALIKIGDGHGCIHPWPELGDEPLDVQLKILADGGESLLIQGAQDCVKLDEKMRHKNLSILPSRIPDSHWLVRPGDDPNFARSEGFTYAKIKGSENFAAVRNELSQWADAGMSIRIDFNEVLAVGGFKPFWDTLSVDERDTIDLIEDPEKYTREGWWNLRLEDVPLAIDRDSGSRQMPGDVVVIKPARPDWGLNSESRYFFTSYMDHALGQMFACAKASFVWGSGENKNLLTCGLLTHRCFEDDEFFERIRCDGPRLLPVEGTGLGFDDLLEKLPWKRLT